MGQEGEGCEKVFIMHSQLTVYPVLIRRGCGKVRKSMIFVGFTI